MPVDTQEIRSFCREVEDIVVHQHLGRLDADYQERFGPEEIARHLQGLLRLSARQPVKVLLIDLDQDAAECVVLAFDHPFEFSLICGVLAASGFHVESGDVITLRPVVAPPGVQRPPRGNRRLARDGDFVASRAHVIRCISASSSTPSEAASPPTRKNGRPMLIV